MGTTGRSRRNRLDVSNSTVSMGNDKTIQEEGAASALKRQRRIKKAPEASKSGDLSQDGLHTTQTSDQEGKSLVGASSPTDAKHFEPLLPGMTEAYAARLQDIINAIKRPKPILN